MNLFTNGYPDGRRLAAELQSRILTVEQLARYNFHNESYDFYLLRLKSLRAELESLHVRS